VEEFLYEEMKTESPEDSVEVQVSLVLRRSLLCLYLDCCIFISFCNAYLQIPFSHTSTSKYLSYCATSLITGGEPVTGLQKVMRGREAETIF
jgi:hypothetical protein